jgi:hypothetical protein
MGTVYEKAFPCVGDILDACTGDGAGPGTWWRCCVGCAIGRGGARPRGRGCRSRGWIYRRTIHCAFLGIWQVRFQKAVPGEIPGRAISTPCYPECAGGGGKPGTIRNRGDLSTIRARAILRATRCGAARAEPRIGFTIGCRRRPRFAPALKGACARCAHGPSDFPGAGGLPYWRAHGPTPESTA